MVPIIFQLQTTIFYFSHLVKMKAVDILSLLFEYVFLFPHS